MIAQTHKPLPPRCLDITGHCYGENGDLEVLGFAGRINGQSYWTCRCSCGSVRDYNLGNLRSGASNRCADCGRKKSREATTVHGLSGTPAYSVWRQMMQSGAGVCDRWHDLEEFAGDMWPRPEGAVLCRKDRTKGYSPENCFWGDWSYANTGKHGKPLEHNGERLLMSDWAKRLGISRQGLLQRIQKYGVEVAFSYGRGQRSPTGKTRRREPVDNGRLSHEARRQRRQQMSQAVQSGKSVREVAAWYGVTTQTVLTAVREFSQK